MTKTTLPNGFILDDDWGMTKTLQKYAEHKGLKNVRVFVATDNKKIRSYLLVIGEVPVFESQKAEDIAAHIDILVLQEKAKKEK